MTKLEKPLGHIAFILDEKLSPEKARLLTRIVNQLRHIAHIELMKGSLTEDELIKRLEEKYYTLVLAPWHRYLAFSKVEAFLGLNRTTGPTFAGYFAEPIEFNQITEPSQHQRVILFDFSELSAQEACKLIANLTLEKKRFGITPFLEPDALVYAESWMNGTTIGNRADVLLSLPPIAEFEWSKRANEIRIALQGLWSLIYDQGSAALSTSNTPRGYFQFAADRKVLLLRAFCSRPGWKYKDVIQNFWPNPHAYSSGLQLLLGYSDFLRIHPIAEAHEIEIVAGFFQSATAQKHPHKLHTFWIEPIAQHLITEPPFEEPHPENPRLKSFPSVASSAVSAPRPGFDEAVRTKERFITEATEQIRALRKSIQQREDEMKELKSGGVGTAPPLPPPDAESLLEAFQEKYFQARFQIRQFEHAVADAEQNGAAPHELEVLKLKMNKLIEQEKEWIKKLGQVLIDIKEERKRTG